MLLLPSSQICCVSNTQNRIIYFAKRSAAWAPLGQVALHMLPPWALFFIVLIEKSRLLAACSDDALSFTARSQIMLPIFGAT